MNGINYLVIAVIVLILGAVIWYLYRSKKRGVKCIGCPSGGNCSGGCSGCSSSCDCAKKQ